MDDKTKTRSKSKLYWRVLRWGLVGLAVLATLAAILVTEEDWRGKRDWEAYKRAAAARGERLDVASAIPPMVPDDQNFFCAPIVATTLASEWNSEAGPRTGTNSAVDRMDFNLWRDHIGNEINQGGNWQKGTLTDLKEWQTALRDFAATPEGKTNGFPVPAQPGAPAADVLFGLSVFDRALAELRQASQRPHMRIPLDYNNDFQSATELLPWLATMKRCAQFLELRSVAELQNNQSEEACGDVRLLLRVNDCIREQPFLISHLVRLAIVQIVIQPIYEGLAQRRWSDAQLAELEQALGKEDFLADYQFAMRGEKLFAIDTLEKQRITRQVRAYGDNQQVVTNSMRWTPAAYFYQSELWNAQMSDQMTPLLVDTTNRIVSPTTWRRTQADLQEQVKHFGPPYKAPVPGTVNALLVAVKRFAFAQASTDLARTACALERYHLAHGEYPASLDALAPQFIERVPHDIINGQSLHYRRTDDGKFVLYSVGWDQKDDGGTVVLTANGTVDRDKGDWVWKY